MKNRLTKVALTIFAIAIASIFFSEYLSPADAHNGYGDPKKTGSPGDGSTCSSCHGPTTKVTGLISSNIPTGGYTPGTVYSVTITATAANKVNFGFSMSPQNASGTLLGTLTNTSSNTQLNSVFGGTANKYVTHTSAGRTGSTGSHSWSVDWTAPAAGTGDVTFYGIVVASNNNGSDDNGDICSREEYLVHEATSCTPPTITGTTGGSRCDAGTVTLGATASAGTINWYAASTGGSSLGTGTSFTTPSISSTTTYYVDATNTCTTATRTAVTATVTATPTITGSTPGSRCGTGTVTLGATASAGTVNWYAASTGGSAIGTGTSFTTPRISTSTDYYAEAVNSGCTSTSRTMVTATVNTEPTITGTTPASRCDAGTITLGATSSAGAISWYAAATGGSSLGTGSSFITPSISSTTPYYVDANDGICTTSTRTQVDATITGGPSITATTPSSRCDAGTVNLGATAATGTINWYAAATGGISLGTGTSFTTPSISATTPYYVDADDGTCVTSTRTQVDATINPLPTATISGDATVCSGASSIISIALTGTSPWSFSYGSATGSNPVSGITTSTYTTSVSAGTYTVSNVTDGNCSGTSSGSATITENSPILVSNLTSTCSGGNYTVDFDISGGDASSYIVTGDAGTLTGSHFTSNPIASGIAYSFTPNDQYNCNSTAQTGTKNCNCAATADITGGGTICGGSVATITITLSGQQPWDFTYAIDGVSQPAITGQTTSPYTFTTSTTGAYTLVSVNDATCTGSTSGNVSVSQTLPTATLSGGGSICNDGSTSTLNITLTGTSPWSYTLSDGTNSTPLTSNIATVSRIESAAGTYTITSVSDATCSGTSSGSATIIVNPLPTVGSTISTSSATVCAGTSVTLSGTGASTYVWTGGSVSVTDGQSFVPTGTTTYTVTGTDANNCSAKATTTVTVNNSPTITVAVTPSSAVVCAGGSVTLTASGAATYIYTGGSGSVTDGQAFVPSASATYTVVGTDVNNCSNYTTRAITVNNLPTVGATASPSSTVCTGSSVTLNGTGAVTYTWSGSTGSVVNGQAFTPSATDTYTIVGTDVNTCTNTATQLITVSSCTNTATPTPSITRPAPGNLLVSSSPVGNQWFLDGVLIPGAVYQTLPLTQTSRSGNYTVIVTVNGVPSAMSDPYNIVNTAVTEINNDSFLKIYPNPNNGTFTISFDVSERASYSIVIKNMLGQSVYAETLGNFSGAYTTQINIADSGQGIYMISLIGPASETIRKIIVY